MPSALVALRPVYVPEAGTFTRAGVLNAYQAATARVAALHREIAQVRIRELQHKSAQYRNSTERSASGREDEARYGAAHVTVEYLDLIGERDAVLAEIDFLKQLIHTMNAE